MPPLRRTAAILLALPSIMVFAAPVLAKPGGRAIRVSIVAAMLLAMVAVQATLASHWTSRTVVDKSVAQECVGATKIEAPQSGVPYIVFFEGFQGTITFTLNGTLSFATDGPSHVLTSLLIQGGPSNAVLYTYAPGVRSDSGLTAPFNPSTGQAYGYQIVCIYTGLGSSTQLYLHNNPTPPTGTTRMQHPLPMNADAPTATTLFNYDTDRDSLAGRLIQKGGSATTTDRTKFQNWRTPTFDDDFLIDGDVSFQFWSAMKDFKTDKRGHVVAYLMAGATVCDTAALNPTTNWQGGSTSWVENTITFDDVDCTIAEDSFLQLRVVVHSSSADDMWFAYDTVAFQSRLILP